MEKLDPHIQIKSYLENHMRSNAAVSVVTRLKNGIAYPLSRSNAVPLIDESQTLNILDGRTGIYRFDSGNDGVRWGYLNSLLSDKNAYITPRVELNFAPTNPGDTGTVTVRLSEGSTELGDRAKNFTDSYQSRSNGPDLTLSIIPTNENNRLNELNDDLIINIEPTGADIEVSNIKLIPEIRADGYRINAAKRVPSFQPEKSKLGELDSVDIDKGELAITFFEQGGVKNPYYETVTSIFVFRCWGKPVSDARKLWSVLDDALHDKNGVQFNNMGVYYSLRAELSELDVEDEITYPGAFDFISAYEIAYWEYQP